MTKPLAIKSKRSTSELAWYSLLAGLATLVTCLNVLPSSEISFRTHVQIVAPKLRILQLQRVAAEDRVNWRQITSPKKRSSNAEQHQERSDSSLETSDSSAAPESLDQAAKGLDKESVWLLGAKQLPQRSLSTNVLSLKSAILTDESVTVADVWAASTRPLSHAELQAWLELQSTPPSDQVVDQRLAQEHRFAWWQKYAAEQYLKNAEYESLSQPEIIPSTADSNTSTDDIATKSEVDLEPNGGPFRNISYPSTNSQEAVGEPSIDDADLAELRQRFAETATAFDMISAKFNENVEDRLGFIALSGSSQITPSGGTPVRSSLTLSLLLALASSGVVAAWLHLSSPRIHTPVEAVQHVFAKHSIPLLAESGTQLGSEDSPTLALADASLPSHWFDAIDSRISQWLPLERVLHICEALLLLWCSGIAIRFFTDSYWRLLLIEQPLAALARIWSGLGL